MKKLFLISILMGFFAVLFGAFGAHILKKYISIENLGVFETANKYHFYHLFAIFMTVMLSKIYEDESFLKIGYLFLIGIFLFSVSLYILAITNIRWLGAITPIGGIILLFSWVFLFWKVAKK